MRGFDAKQARSWDEKGYLVLEGAADPGLISEVRDTIWQALGMRPDHPSDWYDESLRALTGIDQRGMIPIYHDAPLWRCRQLPLLYAAFRDLYGDEDLRVSIDRVNMNPPVRADWPYDGFIHWDIDVARRPVPFVLQGLLALSDSGPGEGGFQCVPGFHRRIEAWLDTQPEGYATRFPDVSGMEIEFVPLKAGDFLIWHSALPHGNTPNRSDRPRLAQYITMKPANQIPAAVQAQQLEAILRGVAPVAPGGTQLPPDAREITFNCHLTELGRRLVGMP
ncbi:phytanoyl-CoA dioxygenase family protein [Maricaulis sp.]|uniref:phytanoyl-CoA dioxygenase family protein n=1 Tax=Maricaulis sp. TaxID=1486257 RepID=UPI0026101DDC|nr:phytanoyl-CoA dioxygenase family protein [Maricaulis sp.]